MSEHLHVEELKGDDGTWVIFCSKEPAVFALSPLGRPVSECSMKYECWVTLCPMLDNVLTQLHPQITAPIRIAHGNIRYEESCCWKGA